MKQAQNSLPPLLVIVGPTGTGKSAVALRLARRFRGELVSADSRQVYIGMDIATNKLKPPRGVTQWLVDVVRPDQPFSVREYQRRALVTIRDIHRRGKLPILVGGTAQYVDAVVKNWRIPRVGQRRLRQVLEQDLEHEGLTALVRRLRHLDPQSARVVDVRNPRRVIRALEVALATGESFIRQRRQGQPRYRVLQIGLQVDRETLRQRLQERSLQMFRRGLIAETKRLQHRYAATLPSMSGIGYAEAAQYLAGQLSRAEAVGLITTHSYQYARRQMTWWRHDESIRWVRTVAEAERAIGGWL